MTARAAAARSGRPSTRDKSFSVISVLVERGMMPNDPRVKRDA
jgi:hypothetical protein